MCVIAYKPYDAPNFTKDILEACWEANSDGAGYAWYEPDTKLWEVRKGFMTFKKFWKSYNSNNFDKHTVVAHFRIGTSGLKDGGNTHPFPLIEDMEQMRQTSFAAKTILFHNGIVGKGDGDYSDTMVYIRDYLAPISSLLGVHPRMPEIYQEIMSKNASRFILCHEDKLWRYGTTWHKEQEWFFSNLTFQRKTSTYFAGYTAHNKYTVVNPPKNDNWKFYQNGYANEYGRMVNGKWMQWAFNEDGTPATTTNFTAAADTRNEDGTIDFAKSKKKKRKGKREASDKEEHSPKNAETGKGSLFCVVGEDGEVEWGEKSKKYFASRGVHYLICPECYEDKFIDNYEGDTGDTICNRCGAIFEDKTGKVVATSMAIRGRLLKSKNFDTITGVPNNFARLTPADRQAIIDAQTDELLANGMY